MSKPEIMALVRNHPKMLRIAQLTKAGKLLEDKEPLIRLTDHETARAADKARIDELMGLLRMTSRILRSEDPAIADTVWCDDGAPETLADRIDSTLAKHGEQL